MGAWTLIGTARRRLLNDEGDLNAGAQEDRTLWRSLAEATRGTIIEFGCGAGRILAALSVSDRSLIGLDRDPEAIAFARERLPNAQILDVDLMDWAPPKSLERSAGLVIAGGDLLPLLLLDEELRRVMDLAAHLVAPDGLFAIDATRMDPALLREAAGRVEWGEDVRWRAADGSEILRDSRILPDPLGRERVAQLQIRHTRHGEGGYVDEREPFHVRAWSPAEVEGAA
ncbi:MAG: class I SAM-dependent methyltransferase, partial [Candidatus Limnocylindrus sp.]